MIGDLGTVMWKEMRELLLQGGNRRGGYLGLMIFAGLLGVYMPLQAGRGWVESPGSLLSWAWVPFFLVSNVVADSFAGERERHTLETLLASRLPDRAVLLGKVSAAVAYGWGFTVAILLLGLVSVNLAYGNGELLLYPAPVAVGSLVLALLAATLVAAAGVLVSLDSATVRQAQFRLSLGVLLLVLLPVFGFQALPSGVQSSLLQSLVAVGPEQALLAGAAVLVVLDGVLLAIGMARFRRARLIV